MSKKPVDRLIKTLLVSLPLCSFLLACNKNKDMSNKPMEIKICQASEGYYVQLSKAGHEYSTNGGSIGIRFDKNDFRADDPIYNNYSSIIETEGGLLAKGSIQGEWGSEVSFNDFYKIVDGVLRVNREFVVTKVGEELGFAVEQKWEEKEEGKIFGKEWFVPGCFDVNGERDFSKIGSRLYYDGSSFVVPAEDVSALQASSLGNQFSFSILDTTSGYREDSIKDAAVGEASYCLIDESFNMPGLYMKDEESGHISYSHIYPSYTNKSQDKYRYRLLPVTEGLTRRISYRISLDKYENYDQMRKAKWREAFDTINFTDKRYKLKDVYDVLINYIDKSYSANNAWGATPQYMTNLDHYSPDSGFLYRNMEFATIMYKYGVENDNQQMINNALTVINFQLDNDCPDTGMKSYVIGNPVYKRVRYDGLSATVELYNVLKSTKCQDENLMNRIYRYIVTKADMYKDEDSPMGAIFYGTLSKYKDLLHLDYVETFKRFLSNISLSTVNYNGFYGAIEYEDPYISVMEDYMIFLRAFITGYQLTYSETYLNEAMRIANHLETFFQLQSINMNLVGATGAEGCHLSWIGNERFLAHGYAFNNTSHSTLDCSTTAALADFYRLYEITGDQHYLDFADSSLYNALLYVNMGDKIGQMDDPKHSSGKGYMQEYAGNATTSGKSSPDGGLRGAAHDSNLGWNVYHYVMALGYLKETGYANFSENENLTHNLASNKVITIEKDNITHTVYNVTDNSDETYYTNSENSELVIDLFEQCEISSIELSGNAQIQLSSDKVNYQSVNELANVNTKARYVKVLVSANEKVNDVKVNGVPVLYQDMTEGSTILSGDEKASAALDNMNYNSIWNLGKLEEASEIVIDLGQECEIYESALKFADIGAVNYKIELSNDNTTYVEYANDDGSVEKYVHVTEKFAQARYVKITINSSSFNTTRLCDIKLLGSK